MAVTGPDFVALEVRDLEASSRFYTEHLGLERPASSPPGAVVFATQPIAFALRQAALELDATERPGAGVALWMRAEGIQDLHDDLMGHGVTIVTEPFAGPFGTTFAFADPDGYVITVHG